MFIDINKINSQAQLSFLSPFIVVATILVAAFTAATSRVFRASDCFVIPEFALTCTYATRICAYMYLNFRRTENSK